MKHFITGYNPKENVQIFKLQLLNLSDLTVIMCWADEGECVFDHELSLDKISEIEEISGVELPRLLDLFLTTESD
jgi:hypothetical protein